jgi:hypothetical protein
MKDQLLNTVKSFTCVVILLVTGVALYAISPDCRKIEANKMVTPLNLENRTDTTGIPPFTFKVFKKENDTWYQCKTIFERKLDIYFK